MHQKRLGGFVLTSQAISLCQLYPAWLLWLRYCYIRRAIPILQAIGTTHSKKLWSHQSQRGWRLWPGLNVIAKLLSQPGAMLQVPVLCTPAPQSPTNNTENSKAAKKIKFRSKHFRNCCSTITKNRSNQLQRGRMSGIAWVPDYILQRTVEPPSPIILENPHIVSCHQ